eukprot:4484-Heterococcus_DN1.PRE.1
MNMLCGRNMRCSCQSKAASCEHHVTRCVCWSSDVSPKLQVQSHTQSVPMQQAAKPQPWPNASCFPERVQSLTAKDI